MNKKMQFLFYFCSCSKFKYKDRLANVVVWSHFTLWATYSSRTHNRSSSIYSKSLSCDERGVIRCKKGNRFCLKRNLVQLTTSYYEIFIYNLMVFENDVLNMKLIWKTYQLHLRIQLYPLHEWFLNAPRTSRT